MNLPGCGLADRGGELGTNCSLFALIDRELCGVLPLLCLCGGDWPGIGRGSVANWRGLGCYEKGRKGASLRYLLRGGVKYRGGGG